MNKIIEQLSAILEDLKKEIKPKDTAVISSGQVKLTAHLHRKVGRITITATEGQTTLSFKNRKRETIKGIGACLIAAADLLDTN